MGLDDLLKILEQASNAQSTGASSNADPLTDLLGSLLGGGTQPMPSSAGSRRTSSASSASPNDALSGMLTPIAGELANKMGLPPELANMVITFALSQLMNSQANAGGSAPARSSGSVLASSRGMLSNADGGLESSNLVAQLTSGKTVDSEFLQSTGLAQQLASQTGMDAQTAASSLEQVFTMLSGNAPAPSAPTSLLGKAGGSASATASKPLSKAESPAKKSSASKSHKK